MVIALDFSDPNGFDNSYYTLLLTEKWNLKIGSNPAQFEDSSKELMMLPADLAIVVDPEFKKWVELYAKDNNAWFADFSKAFEKLLELGVKF
jgi:cytochrome c peroxidase